MVEWLKATGCKPVGLTPYVGSNPTLCTSRAGVAQLVERQPSKLNVASSSLVSRSIKLFVEKWLLRIPKIYGSIIVAIMSVIERNCSGSKPIKTRDYTKAEESG